MGSSSDPHQVVIIGGGFGGLNAARALRRAPVSVTLVDQSNHHLFQPLLYQVATAGLSSADIAIPIRSVLRKQKNATVLMSEVVGIDTRRKKVLLRHGPEIPYDTLVVATGARHAYFGRESWERFAPGLKSLYDATTIRRKILTAFEAAELETDPQKQRAWLNFVIVGGGPTGVELAGSIAELARVVLVKDFRRINPGSARVILIEAGPRVLSGFSEDLSERAKSDLKALGVEVMTGKKVEHVDARGNRSRGRIDPIEDRDLGCRRRRVPGGRVATGRNRSSGTRESPARSHRPGASGGLRDRRRRSFDR